MSIKEKIIEILKQKDVEKIMIKQIVEIYAAKSDNSIMIQQAGVEYSLTVEKFAEKVENNDEIELCAKITLEPIREKFENLRRRR